MLKRSMVVLIGAVLLSPVEAQRAADFRGSTLEGYWQDTARRILYSRTAPPSYSYGTWDTLDQGQTYPSAKHIRRDGAGWEVIDLNADDRDYAVRTITGSDQKVEFVRTVTWSGCAM